MFGFVNKGHLGAGADADITVIDLTKDKAVLGIAGRRKIMVEGVVVGDGGTLLTTEAALRSANGWRVRFEIVDTSKSQLYSPIGAIDRRPSEPAEAVY
jgi:formylmethanofuran dehydrogenase subunit A